MSLYGQLNVTGEKYDYVTNVILNSFICNFKWSLSVV